jgi:hypothetical protein
VHAEILSMTGACLLHRHVGKGDCDHSGSVCGRDEVIVTTVKTVLSSTGLSRNLG